MKIKKIYYLLIYCWVSVSCSSINQISINCLEPGDFNFPSEIRKIGIVDNTLSDRYRTDKKVKENISTMGIKETERYPFVEGKIATESLASSITDQKYFDEVVICDSALREKDKVIRDQILTKEEIFNLTEGLGVDAIISLEDVSIHAYKDLFFRTDWNCFQGTMNVEIIPKIRMYVNTHKGAVFTFTPKDSIEWNEYGNSESQVKSLLPKNKEMIEEASKYAGIIPVKYLVPHWITQSRAYFSSQISTNLRNASYYVENNKWDDAYAIWKKDYDNSRNSGRRMKMAFNMALYNEVNNNIDESLKWLDQSHKYLSENAKTTNVKELKGRNSFYYQLIEAYSKILMKRKEEVPILNAQMSRFDNENK